MANITDFRTDVRIYVPAAPDLAIDRAARRALHEFLRRSEVYRSEIVNGPLDYTLSATSLSLAAAVPSGTQLVRPRTLRWVIGDGRIIPFKTKAQLDELLPDWETETAAEPQYWTMDATDTVRLVPIASATTASAISATVSLSLLDSSTTVPDWIYYRYRETILPGIYSLLYAMPQREWSDPRLAANYGAMFEFNIVKASSDASAEQGRPTRTVKYGGI